MAGVPVRRRGRSTGRPSSGSPPPRDRHRGADNPTLAWGCSPHAWRAGPTEEAGPIAESVEVRSAGDSPRPIESWRLPRVPRPEPRRPGARSTRRVLLHYLEMVAAVFLGMIALGIPAGWLFSAFGTSWSELSTAWMLFAMAITVSLIVSDMGAALVIDEYAGAHPTPTAHVSPCRQPHSPHHRSTSRGARTPRSTGWALARPRARVGAKPHRRGSPDVQRKVGRKVRSAAR
jgi:hypothetical protein